MAVDEQLGLHSVSLALHLYGGKKQDGRRCCKAQMQRGGISGVTDMQGLV
jgi:hypothetical protein